MPPSRNNTIKFSDLAPISAVGAGDLIPVVDTSIPTLVNKKINVQDFSRSLPVSLQVTQLGTNSASWDSTYSTTLANSASWSTGGSYGSVYSANSAEYESTYTSLNTNSANWDSAYTTVKESSAAWVGLTTFTTVNSLSDTWNTGYALASSAYTTLSALSAGYWILKSGDVLTGPLTTTRTITGNFTLDELVTKRYVDAMATATQISGNFVPNLYYTIAQLETGVPLLSSNRLQTNLLNIGQAGASQTGIVTFDENQYGTGVTGYTFNSTGNRSGLRVICGSYARFNASEQGLSYAWGGPTFQNSIFSLGAVNSPGIFVVDHYSLYHPTYPYTVFLRGDNAHRLVVKDYTNVQFNNLVVLSGFWNNASTVYTALSVNVTDIASNVNSLLADFQVGGSSKFNVSKSAIVTLPYGGYFYVPGGGGIYGSGGGNLFVGLQGAARFRFESFNFGVSQGVSLESAGVFMINSTTTPLAWNSDLYLYRDDIGTLGIRTGISPQALRIYNTYTDANNYERLGLSATRIAYERAGTGSVRDLTIATPGNLILSGASISFNTATPFAFGTLSLSADRIRLPRTNATFVDPHISIAFNDNMFWLCDGNNYIKTGAGPSVIIGSYLDQAAAATRINGVANSYNFWLTRDSSLCWGNANPFPTGFNEGADLFLFRDAPYTLAIRDRVAQAGTNALRIYRTYTDSTNYERLSLSGDRIQFEYNTGPSGNIAYGSIRRGIYGGIAYYQGNTWMGMFPGETGDFHINSTKEIKWGTGEQWWAYDLSLARDEADRLALRRSTNNQAFRIYNTYTDANNYERLSLSATRIAYEAAGTGVSRDLTIQSTGNIVLSAGGAINLSQALPTMFDNLSARILTVGPSDAVIGGSQGVLRVPTSPGSTGYPGIIAYANNSPFTVPTSIPNSRIGLATFGGMGYQNTSLTYATNIQANRIIVNPPGAILSPTNWDNETDIAIKVGGNIGFTVNQLDGSNQARPLSATMGYDWSTNLINLSGRAGKVGFRFDSVDGTPQRPEIYNDGYLTITSNFGGGRPIYFKGIQNQGWNPFTLTAYGAYAYGTIEITATQQSGIGYTLPYFKIIQDVKQLSNFVQIVSSNNTTIFSYSSAGVLNLNDRIFAKPNGLIQFNNIGDAAPAIKGTTTTVQARTGDDSQYTFLQGKLQTDQAANAGTFTPDKYIILYDSTGTAYKVPVQAL